MNFGQAIELLKQSKRVSRNGWNGKGMWLQLYKPHEDEGVVMSFDGTGRWIPCAPYIGMKTADDTYVPWIASQTDMLAEDWEEVA
jgi:hypothetical protein